MATATGLQLSNVAESLALSRAALARLLGASESTISRWMRGTPVSRQSSIVRLYELQAVGDALAKVMTQEAGAMWLRRGNPLLDGRTPLSLIADGRYREVLGLVEALGEGIVV